MGHFDPLILLRVESGCPLGNLIFNDLEALQVESSAHFDHLIFTEWGVTCYRKTEVLKMITPVVLLRMKSGCHFDTAKIKFPKWCAPRQEDNEINQPKISQAAFK